MKMKMTSKKKTNNGGMAKIMKSSYQQWRQQRKAA
jgi:hypothetical protein